MGLRFRLKACFLSLFVLIIVGIIEMVFCFFFFNFYGKTFNSNEGMQNELEKLGF